MGTRQCARSPGLAEVDAHVEPFRGLLGLLTSIPGVSDLSASVILAEIGADMSRFPSAGHLVSSTKLTKGSAWRSQVEWSAEGGPCPRNDERAGKRRSNRMRKGAPWLKTTLTQCAWAGARKKGSYPQAQFQRLRVRDAPSKWHRRGVDPDRDPPYADQPNDLRGSETLPDLGGDHFDRRAKTAQTKRLVGEFDISSQTVRRPTTA